jgi:hypothetical protein
LRQVSALIGSRRPVPGLVTRLSPWPMRARSDGRRLTACHALPQLGGVLGARTTIWRLPAVSDGAQRAAKGP